MAKGKYAKLPQLYVTGGELELRNGDVLWLQVLNPYEMHEARTDAQTAKARIVLALKGPEGGDERTSLEGSFYEMGREEVIRQLSDLHATRELPNIVGRIEDEEDWKEKVLVMNRSEEILSRPPEDEENQLLERINREFIEEVNNRQEAERQARIAEFGQYSDEDLMAELVEVVVEQRGNERAAEEYALTEASYAARACDGSKNGDGAYHHDSCDHDERIWTKQELRELPEGLQDAIFVKMRELNLTAREAKNSDRPGSSFDSSPRPSEQEESTASTSPVTPEEAPGSS